MSEVPLYGRRRMALLACSKQGMAEQAGAPRRWTQETSNEKAFKLKLSGNEVYYTNALLLLIKNMLCSKLHCQKGFELKLFLYKTRTTHPGPHNLTAVTRTRPPGRDTYWIPSRHRGRQM